MGDWQPGDLALCVDDSLRDLSHQVIKRGITYEVEELDIDPAFADIGLHLVGIPRPWSSHWQREIGWSEHRFVKITPDKADEFDREVIDLMLGRKVEA